MFFYRTVVVIATEIFINVKVEIKVNMKYLCWRVFPEKLWDVRAGMTLEPRNKHGVAQRGVNAKIFEPLLG